MRPRPTGMRSLLIIFVFVSSLGLNTIFSPIASAEEIVDAEKKINVYAELPRTGSVRISPSGNFLAIVQPYKANAAVFVYDLNNQNSKVKVIPAPEDAIIKSIFWGGDKNIVMRVQFARKDSNARTRNKKVLLNRYVSYNINDRKPAILMDKVLKKTASRAYAGSRMNRSRLVRDAGFVVHSMPSDDNKIVMGRYQYLAPNFVLQLYEVELNSGKANKIKRFPYTAQSIIMDNEGKNILARSDYNRDTNTYKVFAIKGEDEKEIFSKTSPKDENPHLLLAGITQDKTKVIMVNTEATTNRLFTIHMETGEQGTYRLEKSAPAGLNFSPIYDQYTEEPIGIAYVDDMRVQSFFSHPFKNWHKSIKKALAGKNINLTSWTKNRDMVIVYAEGTTDAGEYYLFEPKTKSISSLGKRYPELTRSEVGRTVRIDYNARDGLKIPAYLTLPPGKTINNGPFSLVVMPHGGPQARDDAHFDFWAQYYAAHNIAVFKPNYRGSDGYGIKYVKKGHGEFGGKMLDDTIDGVKYLINRGIVNKDKICVAGASYGGYQAFALPTRDKDMFQCSISVNGVSHLPDMLKWVAGGRGSGRNNAASRYWHKWMGHYTKNKDKLISFSPALNLNGVKTEFVIMHGELDPVVPYEQSEIMHKALEKAGNPAKLIEFLNDDHNLSRATSRKIMLKESRELFKKHLDWKD